MRLPELPVFVLKKSRKKQINLTLTTPLSEGRG